MTMKRETCKCGAMNFPHRYSHWCDMWMSTREEEQRDSRTEADDAMDDPRRESRVPMATAESIYD